MLTLPRLLAFVTFASLGSFVFSDRAFNWRMRRFREREDQRLSKMSVEELGADVAKTVLAYKWERFDAGARCVRTWTSAEELVMVLKDLYAALCEHDMATHGNTGRGGQSFEFYDSGLGAIAESLESRVTSA